ncbi:MAG: Abi-alpha family protein [Cyclobacteriaceae bacterium]|jgi:hypothetical protein|nr:Abi-alpha family protein [Cyclobacteriaceae bacterium]
MENKKIDITSTALEKGIDTAKEFLDKLIMPAIEETGLLLKDKVTMWKFKNQVRMLNKAKIYCEKNNISPKIISLKLLCPLLDYSGFEEDEILQDKWAVLLSNLVDSEQNIENHVFPYILSQLSSKEFQILDKVYDEKLERVRKLKIELEEFKAKRPELERQLNVKIAELNERIAQVELKTKALFNNEVWEIQKEKRKHESELHTIKHNESTIMFKIGRPATIPYDSLKEYELSNVIRLGLVKEEKEFYARSQTLEIPNDRDDDRRYINIDLEIDVESDKDNILTELGELFINACKEKNSH